MTNFPPIIVRWLIYLTYIYIRNRTRFSKISIIHLFLNYLLFKSICQKIIILKKYLRLHITNQRYRYCSNEAEERKKNEKWKISSPRYVHYENAGTRVFGSGNTWTLEIVMERHLMKHPVHEYTYVRHVRTYEERLSVVSLSLSLSFSRERSGSGTIRLLPSQQHRFIGWPSSHHELQSTGRV